jgi:hypothetical protein
MEMILPLLSFLPCASVLRRGRSARRQQQTAVAPPASFRTFGAEFAAHSLAPWQWHSRFLLLICYNRQVLHPAAGPCALVRHRGDRGGGASLLLLFARPMQNAPDGSQRRLARQKIV